MRYWSLLCWDDEELSLFLQEGSKQVLTSSYFFLRKVWMIYLNLSVVFLRPDGWLRGARGRLSVTPWRWPSLDLTRVRWGWQFYHKILTTDLPSVRTRAREFSVSLNISKVWWTEYGIRNVLYLVSTVCVYIFSLSPFFISRIIFIMKSFIGILIQSNYFF